MAQPSTIYKPGPLKYVWNYLSYKFDDFKAKLLGYRVYRALLTQSNGDDPVATVVENSLNLQVTYQWDSAGIYYAYISAPLFDGPTATIDGRKVEVTITPNYTISTNTTDVAFSAYPVFFDVISISSTEELAFADNLMGTFCSVALEIKVYNK